MKSPAAQSGRDVTVWPGPGHYVTAEPSVCLTSPNRPAPSPAAGSRARRRDTWRQRQHRQRDDHRRAARHLRQHAGRVALPPRRALPLRGRQQPQEAGVRPPGHAPHQHPRHRSPAYLPPSCPAPW